MNKHIHLLSNEVKKMIAAGEVVEGPFSVIKELLENAIDAKSDQIHIEIEDSGLKKIVIRDNGEGIYKKDLKFAISEHATSKIGNINDINKILTFGFRGEALSSISSISRLTILSRTDEEKIGGKIISEAGIIKESDYAGPRGTTIIVENLFYNTPARKKFLKSKAAESRSIKEIFIKTALAHPEISLTLDIQGKKALKLLKAKDHKERIKQVFSSSDVESLYFDKVLDMQVEINGFFSKPDYIKNSRSMQYIFVNKRPVEYKYLGFLLTRAYEAIVPKGKYPAAIIYININPELIDVNIHPAKKVIKFFDNKYIDNLIYGLVKKILNKQEHKLNYEEIYQQNIKKNNINVENISNFNKSLFDEGNAITIDKNIKNYTLSSNRESEIKNIVKDSENLYNLIEQNKNGIILGIIFGTYILVEINDSLKIIDFHAAHERFIYDELIKNGFQITTQELLFPQVIELSIKNFDCAEEKLQYLKNNGIDIDIFSDNSVIIRGVPDYIKDIDLNKFVIDLLEKLNDDQNIQKSNDEIIAERIACHSAKRAND